jgi:hypothetical protein
MSGLGGAYAGRNIPGTFQFGKGVPTHMAPNGTQWNQHDGGATAIVWINTSGPGIVGNTWTLLSSGGGGGVASVTGQAPIASSGGANPVISLNPGSNGQVLSTVGGVPAWANPSGVQSLAVTAPINNTGTATNPNIGLTLPLPVADLAPAGTNGYVLTTVGGVPLWAPASGGGVSYNIDGAINALTNLTHFWKCNDAASATACADSVGSTGLTLIQSGTAPLPSLGAPSITGDGETCVNLNGFGTNNSGLLIPNGLIPSTGNFTLGFVFKLLFTNGQFQALFCQDVNNTFVSHVDTGAQINWGVGANQGGSSRYTGTGPIPLLYMYVVNRTAGTTSLYVDGGFVATYNTVPGAQASVGVFGYRLDNTWSVAGYFSKIFMTSDAKTLADAWTLRAQLPA